jgi:hypothetical protein
MQKSAFDVSILVIIILAALGLVNRSAEAQVDQYTQFACKLSGTHEVPPISTPGAEGICAAIVGADNSSITVIALFSGLKGTAVASHLHYGQENVAGGIVVHLCGTGGKPPCPAAGTLTVTVGAGDVVDLPAQGIDAGELGEVIRALRMGLIYLNIHTDVFPSGEVRGQLR